MGTALPTETGFDLFYRQHRSRLVATLNAASRCGADAATDAVDEAFVRALAHWHRVQRMEAPAGWVFTVARNQLRRTKSRKVVEQQLVRRAADADVGAAADSANWELWEAVGALPERERTAVALRYLADMTERQVAETMGIAPGTVAATLHAARKHLAERLAEPMEVTPDGRA
jgi:RNA polymerase sigma factor (sigma-70 family)